MTTPEFGDIGKTVKDLLTKEYNFGKTKLEVKSTTASKVEFTSSFERNDKDGVIKGDLKTKLTHADTGLVFTDTYSTNHDLSVKIEAPDVVDGLKVEVDTTFNPPTAKKEIKFGLTYKSPSFVFTTSANVFQSPKAKIDAVVGYEGIIAGAQVTVDPTKPALADYALAVGYTEKDYGVTVHANKQLTQFVGGYSHNVSKDVTIAAQATVGTTDRVLFEVGAQYKLDSATTIKSKFDTSGKVSFGLIQKIRPDLKATFGLLVDSSKLAEGAHNFGYSLTFEPK